MSSNIFSFKKSCIKGLSLIFILCISCNLNKNNYYIYVIFDNVDGLDSKSLVTSKGIKIGEIKEMNLYEKGVIVKIQINDDLKISKKSKFFYT